MVNAGNNSRFLRFYLKNGQMAVDLTGCQVYFSTSFNMALGESNIEAEGVIEDYVNGIIKVELISSMTPKKNVSQDFQISFRKVNGVADTDSLTFPKFSIFIGERVLNEPHLIAQNESQILDELNAVNVNLQECIDRVGYPTDAETKATVFGRIKQIYNYLTGTILTKLNGIISTQGSHTTSLNTLNSNVNIVKSNTEDIKSEQDNQTNILENIDVTLETMAAGVVAYSSPWGTGVTDVKLDYNYDNSISINDENKYICVGTFVPARSGTIQVYLKGNYTILTNNNMRAYGRIATNGNYKTGNSYVSISGSDSEGILDFYLYNYLEVGTPTDVEAWESFFNVEAGKSYAILIGGFTVTEDSFTMNSCHASISFTKLIDYMSFD